MSPIFLPPPPYVIAGPVTTAIFSFERVLVGRSATLTVTFTNSSGAAADPDPDEATVSISRYSDGAEVEAETAATEAGVGVFTFDLTPTHTVSLDFLLVTWTATIDGDEQSVTQMVEVCGGFLFSVSQARAIEPLNNTTKFPAANVTAYRTLAEQALEDACGVAFVPRYRKETVNGTGSTSLLPSQPNVIAIRSVDIDGIEYTQDQLDAVAPTPGGGIYTSTGWAAGYGNVAIGYEHGHTFPPARVSRAALLLARAWLVSGPIDDRTATFSVVDGGSYSLVTPGRNGSWVGIPEVDAVIDQYSMRTGIS